jgi:hypothetical protein
MKIFSNFSHKPLAIFSEKADAQDRLESSGLRATHRNEIARLWLSKPKRQNNSDISLLAQTRSKQDNYQSKKNNLALKEDHVCYDL